mmetsp:Transcript_62357/g.117299  ORF Transcript_62357/g.117299 Transcript_62357/m.117299 type:complete len:241 (+) Transcript_62357:156-878(+)
MANSSVYIGIVHIAFFCLFAPQNQIFVTSRNTMKRNNQPYYSYRAGEEDVVNEIPKNARALPVFIKQHKVGGTTIATILDCVAMRDTNLLKVLSEWGNHGTPDKLCSNKISPRVNTTNGWHGPWGHTTLLRCWLFRTNSSNFNAASRLHSASSPSRKTHVSDVLLFSPQHPTRFCGPPLQRPQGAVWRGGEARHHFSGQRQFSAGGRHSPGDGAALEHLTTNVDEQRLKASWHRRNYRRF